MSHLQPSEVPYGVYYCRSCCGLMPCDVAVDASRSDPDCALECLTCHERIGEEVDVRRSWPLPPVVVTRQTLTSDQRKAGRALARKMALGVFDQEPPLAVPAPVAAPPPGYRDRVTADIERLRGRR